MPHPFLHEPAEWKGFWWLPEDSEQKCPGFLKYDPHKGIQLTLIGGFDETIWEDVAPAGRSRSGETRSFPVILGLSAGGKEITLFDAYPAHSTTVGLGIGLGPSEQTIHAADALVGTHVSDPNQEVFSRLVCSIEDTLAWSGSDAITAQIHWDSHRKALSGDGTITLKPVDDLTAEFAGVKYSLAHWLTLPAYDHTRIGSQGRVNDNPVFSLKVEEASSLTLFIRQMYALVDLLALATGRNPAPLWIILEVPSGYDTCPCAERMPWKDPEVLRRLSIPHKPETCPKVRPRQVHLYSRGRGIGDPGAEAVSSHSVVFTLTDIPFDEVLPRWFEVRKKFQAPCNILISARYSKEAYVESSTITAVAAAEAFHMELKEPPPIPPDVMKDLVTRAVKAMPEDRKQWIKQVIPKGHSLRQRLERLAERMPDSCCDRLLPDPKRWAQAASRARNSLSHSGKSEVDVMGLYAVMRVTRAVVLVNILLELGLAEDRILNALIENRELNDACSLSREHFSVVQPG
ncbi:ApeA N-terminal domain 1-containing protein [Brevibacterium luteolum]|uniref:ApeA N-terminal domain 1-containing protein n=1 Tax=Brevibacterium luteolum TaxID=199591 RepID=UPI00223C1CEB|nr:HEPN domain-containing protein [Brevibacterium luteolum]MCT1829591.1 hypothetical protein [Brevibacterium luteolum]